METNFNYYGFFRRLPKCQNRWNRSNDQWIPYHPLTKIVGMSTLKNQNNFLAVHTMISPIPNFHENFNQSALLICQKCWENSRFGIHVFSCYWLFSSETIKLVKRFLKNSEFIVGSGEQDKWYFVIKIVLTYCEKKCSSDQAKLLNNLFRSKRPEQFLVTECFFNLFLEVSHI